MTTLTFDATSSRTHIAHRESVLKQTSAEGAFKAICEIFKGYGFTEAYYSYGAVRIAPGKLNNLRLEKIVILQSSLNKKRTQYFEDYYNPNRAFDKDPTLLPFHHGNSNPFISGLGYVEEGLLSLDETYLPYMEQASEIMGSGSVIFPVMTPETSRIPSGSLTAISNLRGQALKDATTDMMRHVPGLINVFIEKAMPLTKSLMQNDVGLTKREKECLQYIANGFRTIDIAEHLTRSKSMIDRHVATARKKLRARTLPEAVARALNYEIIEL